MAKVSDLRKELDKLVRKNNPKATQLALEIVTLEPENSVNYKNLARTLLTFGENERAIAIPDLMIKRLPHEIAIYAVFKAEVLDYLKDRRSVIEHVAHHVKSGQLDLATATNLAGLYLKNEGDAAAFVKLISNAELIDNLQETLKIRVAAQLFDAGKQSEARTLAENAAIPEKLSYDDQKNLATIYSNVSESKKALAMIEKIISNPNNPPELRDLNLLERAKLEHKNTLCERALETLDQIKAGSACYSEAQRLKTFFLCYSDRHRISEIKSCAENFKRSIAPKSDSRAKNRDALSTVKVGFLSGSFKAHPVGWMTAGFFSEAPRFENVAKIEVIDTKPGSDFVAKTIRNSGNGYHNVAGLDDQELFDYLNDLELDVLVDLEGLSLANRLSVVLRKPAPFVVKWIGGLTGSTWFSEFDALITDSAHTPTELRSDFSEQLVTMSHSYATYTPPPYKIPVLEAPVSINGFITFGCFNNVAKLSDECISTWAQILLSTEKKSQLIIKDKALDDALCRETLQSKFEDEGLMREQLIFMGGTDHERHLKAIQTVDICLDPMPYSGGLSTLEALWLGVPVVTKSGRLLAHRHSTSHLTNVGHTELIANDTDQYCKLAVDLADHPEQIHYYRKVLRHDLLKSKLLDHVGFSEELIKKMVALTSIKATT